MVYVIFKDTADFKLGHDLGGPSLKQRISVEEEEVRDSKRLEGGFNNCF